MCAKLHKKSQIPIQKSLLFQDFSEVVRKSAVQLLFIILFNLTFGSMLPLYLKEIEEDKRR